MKPINIRGGGGLIFGPGIFFSFVGSTTVFRILIFAPIWSSPSLEIRSDPPTPTPPGEFTELKKSF